jgi:FixJ family two-component response regulator
MQQADASRLVVVVEDDQDLSRALQFALEIEGYAVHCHADAEAYLRSADRRAGGCLVVDHVLPGMSGLDMLAHLAAEGAPAAAILITTNPGAALRRRADAAGVPIVEKPLLGNALAEAIRSTFERRA